jgi:hypothetical protein
MTVAARDDAVSVLKESRTATVTACNSLRFFIRQPSSFCSFLIAENREKWEEDLLLLPRNKES